MRLLKKKKTIDQEQNPEIILSREFIEVVDDRESSRDSKIRSYVLKPLKIVLKAFTLLILCCMFIVVFTGLGIYLKYSKEFESVKPQSNSTQLIIYDKDGKEVFRGFGASEPQRIKLSEVPDLVKKTTLASEDLDYYKHGAVDFKSIARAVYLNWQNSKSTGLNKFKDLLEADNYTQGGSTITQQLVKNIYLNQERTFDRKIKEMVFSYKLENKYSKDQILEMYLNEIYYGEQALGIKNAAKIYFNKNIDELNLAEASMIAGLPAAPSIYTPLEEKNAQASRKRQEYVLQQMLLAGYINIEEAKTAANEYIEYYGKTETFDKYPFYSQFVKEELEKELKVTNIEDKGYRIYTSLDPAKQEIAERQAKAGIKTLASRGASNAAVVISDPKTNQILAMVGGIDWDKSKVNVATSERQPGSSFKPIVYATALENNYTAATILNDKSVNFGGNPAYMPKNYNGGYSGYVTVRNALARSLNVPAVEMAKLVGTDKVVAMAHQLGITSINQPVENYGLSLALGSAEVHLKDMVEAYSGFANHGEKIQQTTITKIMDKTGQDVKVPSRKRQQVLSPETSYIITSILSDNKARSATFGASSPLKTDKITAVKTGTTDNYADSWTIGYSPDLVVGVWMGNNDRTPMRRVSGVEGAAYIWHDIITECLKDSPNKEFEKPATIQEAWVNSYNGALSKYQGSPNTLEYFKPNTVPKDKVDLSYLKQF